MNAPGLSFRSYRLAPRAPRVAIVLPGGPLWQAWARVALQRASATWGGAGFILVPHEAGVVAPQMLQAVERYDPDYVVPLDLRDYPLADLSWPDEGDQYSVPLPPDGAIRQVRDASTPYRYWDVLEARWDDHDASLPEPPGYNRTLLPADGPLFHMESWRSSADRGSLKAVRSDAFGAAALIAASTLGSLETPALERLTALDELESEYELEIADSVVSCDWGGPSDDLLVNADAASSAFRATQRGLVPVGTGARRASALITLGDTATDFALALAWDRIYTAPGIWLPLAWSPARDTEWAACIWGAVTRRLLRHTSPSIGITSTSLARSALQSAVDALKGRADMPEQIQVRAPRLVDATGMPLPREGRKHLSVDTQFDHEFSIAVAVDASGAATMMASPPLPAITEPQLATDLPAGWEVDVQDTDSLMPTGRGIDGRVLTADPQDWQTWVRSGRDGLSYNAQRFDFTSSRSTPERNLARPRLRELSLLDWSASLARPEGYGVQLSDAGLRVETLSTMLGGRRPTQDLLVGEMRQAFRAFIPTAKASRDAYPDGTGCVVDGAGYLTFDGMADRARSLARSEIRALVDTALKAQVLRRGLILGCESCRRPAFVAVGDLAQVNTCPRCGAQNDLVQPRWRQPVEGEPTWHYQLHPVAVALFSSNGDVPLLLAAHLRRNARRYSDLSEIELVTGSDPRAECDLLAHADGLVMTAEAKVNGSLNDGKEKLAKACAKRALLAEQLRADQIILATTSDKWDAASVAAMRQVLSDTRWTRGVKPSLRLISGLGTESIQDSIDAA